MRVSLFALYINASRRTSIGTHKTGIQCPAKIEPGPVLLWRINTKKNQAPWQDGQVLKATQNLKALLGVDGLTTEMDGATPDDRLIKFSQKLGGQARGQFPAESPDVPATKVGTLPHSRNSVHEMPSHPAAWLTPNQRIK